MSDLVCKHNQLARSCERCDDAAEIARLKALLRWARERVHPSVCDVSGGSTTKEYKSKLREIAAAMGGELWNRRRSTR